MGSILGEHDHEDWLERGPGTRAQREDALREITRCLLDELPACPWAVADCHFHRLREAGFFAMMPVLLPDGHIAHLHAGVDAHRYYRTIWTGDGTHYREWVPILRFWAGSTLRMR